ncbi:thioesterase family protein [Alteromonas sp. C1M14]|uniref:acyl-CoA thioesterase n=1 Tax=Alteromonas sp. C1M14 TaxID=2841567 RepID=UPI001C0817C1|nr:thioesterase family protein [Alteromonas sp. C1M14]MBU2978973.1 thioesterase family protein [Alteromonas sp. C1M14]
MHIDELLTPPDMKEIGPQQWRSEPRLIPKSWSQGRTAFGGISAGMIYQAIVSQVTDERVLRAYTTNFVGPLQVDFPFTVEVNCLRSGKNVSHFTAQIVQNHRVCVFVQACFGQGRKSKIHIASTDMHGMDEPKKAKFIPLIPKVTPKFFQHFELAIEKGGMPFLGHKDSAYHGFIRYKKPPQYISDAHLISMIDAWPPTILQQLRWPAPASTVSWNLEFLHPHQEVPSNAWFAYKAETRQAGNGYSHTEATIWNQYNDVIALSRQTVAVFD